MRIASISDIHLGARDISDSFRHPESELLSFLSYLENRYDLIVLNGDTFETRKGELPYTNQRRMKRIYQSRQNVVDHMVSSKYLFIRGNHDYFIKDFNATDHFEYTEKDGERYVFFHGHQYDPFSFPLKVDEFFTWVMGMYQRMVSSQADRFFRGRMARIRKFQEKVCFKKVMLRENCHANPSQNVVFLLAHTHVLKKVKISDEITVMNSGTCLHEDFEFSSVDTCSKDYFVGRWRNGRVVLPDDYSSPYLDLTVNLTGDTSWPGSSEEHS